MRHRRKGRKLGRSPSHQRALLRSLASALFLTERDAEFDDNKPKVKGRIITTISKAKEVRPLVEKCITVARRGLAAEEAAGEFGTNAERGTDAWKTWRKSEKWGKWNQAIAPVGRRPPSLLAAARRQDKPFACCSPKSPRGSPIDRAATPASCAWRSPASAMLAPVRCSSSSAFAIAWSNAAFARPSKASRSPKAKAIKRSSPLALSRLQAN